MVLIFLAGLSIFMYPYAADYINSSRQSRVVAQYYTDLNALNEEDFREMFAAAKSYNEKLAGKQNRFTFSEQDASEYMELLNPFGNSLMGTLNISRINVNLPIYHGTGEGVLQIGAGHLEGSSLPVGGSGTHAAITGHRGLPSSTLLSKLDKMQLGDSFVLNILNETLTYQIDRILVVEPEDMSALEIEPDMDYCTLVTCTPYGVNSHRLLLRGHRVDNAPAPGAQESNASAVDELLVAAIIFLPVLIIVLVCLIIRVKRIKMNPGDFIERF